jgi:hypothetical protein
MAVPEVARGKQTRVRVNGRVEVDLKVGPTPPHPTPPTPPTQLALALFFPLGSAAELRAGWGGGWELLPPDVETLLETCTPLLSLGAVAAETEIERGRVQELAAFLVNEGAAVLGAPLGARSRFAVSRKAGGMGKVLGLQGAFCRRFRAAGGEAAVHYVTAVLGGGRALGDVLRDEAVLRRVGEMLESHPDSPPPSAADVLLDMCAWMRANGALVELEEFLHERSGTGAGLGAAKRRGSALGQGGRVGNVGSWALGEEISLNEYGEAEAERGEEEEQEGRRLLGMLREKGCLGGRVGVRMCKWMLGIEDEAWTAFVNWGEATNRIQVVQRPDE